MTEPLREDSALPPPPGLGRSLHRWRAVTRMKQTEAAEFFGVTQNTIFRRETGIHDIGPAEYAKIEAVLVAPMDPASESASRGSLAGLLVRARVVEFSMSLISIKGRSLQHYATAATQLAEGELRRVGWRDLPLAMPREFDTGENRSDQIRIVASRCRWTCLTLADGSACRLVERVSRD